MGSRRNPFFELVLFDTEVLPGAILAQGSGFPSSNFTESGPAPGAAVPADPASRYRPQISGAQSVSLTLAMIVGGFNARAIYRLATDTTQADYRGWSEPNLPTNWSGPASGWVVGSQVTTTRAMASLPNGEVIVVGCDGTTGLTWAYNPRTEAWEDRFDWGTGPDLKPPIAMVYDPLTSRLILWSGSGDAGEPTTRAYQSSDGGDTWTLYARGSYPVDTVSTDKVRVAVDPRGGDWLAIIASNQCASSDGGITWELVEDISAEIAALPAENAVPMRTRNGWVVAYKKASASEPAWRILPSARSSFTAQDEDFLAESCEDIIGTVDDDGAVYLLTHGTSASTKRHLWQVHRSVDGGRSFVTYMWDITLGNDARVADLQVMCASCGRLHLAYGYTSGEQVNVTGTVPLLSFGGWSNVEQGAGVAFGFGDQARFSYSSFNSGSGLFWLPFAFPEDMGWTQSGATGTRTFNGTIPGLKITTTGGTAEIYTKLQAGGAFLGFVAGEAELQVDAASATLATIGTTLPGLFLSPHLGNVGGTLQYAPFIDIGKDGIQVRDGVTIKASVSISTTAHPVHIRWMLRPGAISVWYRIQGQAPEIWTLFCDDETISDSGGITTAGLIWGHESQSDGVATWMMSAFANGGEWLAGIDSAAQSDLTSSDGVRGMRWGKEVPPSATAQYPVPEATVDGEELGFLSATGGPAKEGQDGVFSLPVEYLHGIQHIHPVVSPSPRRYYEPAEDDDLEIAYDFGFEAWHGGAIALLLKDCRARTVTIQIDDGAGAWGTDTLTMDFAVVTAALYTLTGDWLVPRTSTPVTDRFRYENELIGGWVLMQTAGTPVYREIIRSTQGFWTSDTTVQQVRIQVAGIDLTEVVSGTGTIYHHSGLLTVYWTAVKIRRYLRLVVEALDVGGLPVRLGLAGVGRVVGVGTIPGWDWTQRLDLSRRTTRDGEGAIQVQRSGPSRRTWTYGWQDGSALQELRLLTASPDYIAGPSGNPIGTEQDAWTIWDYCDSGMLSGERPCVIVPRGAQSNGNVKDPTRYLYGRLVAESFVVSGFAGTEGVDEFIRVDGPTVEEIR